MGRLAAAFLGLICKNSNGYGFNTSRVISPVVSPLVTVIVQQPGSEKLKPVPHS